jgi:hypothetical protein
VPGSISQRYGSTDPDPHQKFHGSPTLLIGNKYQIVKAEVEVWNPLTDLTPIHTWLHPWLPPLGNRLEIVYPPIRNKLAAALASWHPGTKRPSYCIKLYFNFILHISVFLV